MVYLSSHYDIREVVSGSSENFSYIFEFISIICILYLIIVGWYGAIISFMGGNKCVFLRGDKLSFITLSGYKVFHVSEINNVQINNRFTGKYLIINTKHKAYKIIANLMNVQGLDEANLMISSKIISSPK